MNNFFLKKKSYSLRTRLMIGATCTAFIFILGLFPVLQQAFTKALEKAVQQRLAADASTLISVARIEEGRLSMPEKLPDEEFDILSARQLGFIFDSQGKLVWHSRSAKQYEINYQPRYDGRGHEFAKIRDSQEQEFFVYDIEIDLLRGQSAAYSIVTMQPVSDYKPMYKSLRRQLNTWLAAALICLLSILWLGLNWGTRSLLRLRVELDEVEAGQRKLLSDEHPRELLRLTGSLNRLLENERQQRLRYVHSLDDLAHSLKTPLAVLQGVAEVLATQPENKEQARTLHNQVSRMSQQVSYQLQRASLRRSGLIRHSVKLAPLLEPLIEALNKVYLDKQVDVQMRFSREQRVPVEHGALLEVFGNLLENSYRLCLRQICICVQTYEQYCEIVVEDDGPGVPASQRERILRRGERLDTQYPGQGIGTAVVKDIIDSYQGLLFIEDSELGGAKFRIIFPLH